MVHHYIHNNRAGNSAVIFLTSVRHLLYISPLLFNIKYDMISIMIYTIMTITVSKKFIAIFIALVIIIAGAYGYYHFVFTRTPEYSVNIIRTAVKNHDAETFNKHVDIDSIVNDWIDKEVEKDASVKNDPLASALVPVTKNILAGSIKNAVTAAVADTQANSSKTGAATSSPIDNVTADKGDLSLKDVSSVKNADDTAEITLVVENTTKKTSATIKLKASRLTDGTWKIIALENPEELEKL